MVNSSPVSHFTWVVVVIGRTVEVGVGVVLLSHVAELAAICRSPASSLAVESGAVGMLVRLEVGGLLQTVDND